MRSTDLKPYIEVINNITKQLAEEIRMTTITEFVARPRPTLDTPEGTIIRLIDGTHMGADTGALALVGDGSKIVSRANRELYLDVRWFKGGNRQMDGAYSPEQFEIFPFQVGDRVSIVGTAFEDGLTGTIATVPAGNSDDCMVDMDDRTYPMSYRFEHLEKLGFKPGDHARIVGNSLDNPCGKHHFEVGTVVEVLPDRGFLGTQRTRGWAAEWDTETEQGVLPQDLVFTTDELTTEPEEALAEWEQELLEAVTPKFAAGDVVVIDQAVTMQKWVGLRFKVAGVGTTDAYLENNAIDSRPDGFKGNFYWPIDKLRAFDPERDFRVGDLVEAARFGVDGEPAEGVVTATEVFLGGDIEVNWSAGHSTLVAYGPIGARRIHLTLVGAGAEIRSDFGFEAGQEIGSSEVLADLPMGTVLVINGDEQSPIVKLDKGKFGRINRYAVEHAVSYNLRAYDETENVAQAADGEGTLVIAYVPSESN